MASLGGLQMVHLAWLGISGTYSSGSLAWPPGGCVGSSWGKMSLLTCFVVVATKNEWTVAFIRMGVPGELSYCACWKFG